MKINIKFILIHIFLPIFFGGTIYILFRTKDLLMFKWFYSLGLYNFINSLRNIFYQYKYLIPKGIIFSLPDALWVYSFTMFLSLFFENFFTISFVFLVSIIVEIFQLNFVTGTFDVNDLIYMFLFYLFAIYILKKEKKK